jgi:hypothetical protein
MSAVPFSKNGRISEGVHFFFSSNCANMTVTRFSTEILRQLEDKETPHLGRHPNPLLSLPKMAEDRAFIYIFSGRKWPATIYRHPLCIINCDRTDEFTVSLFEIVGAGCFLERYECSSAETSLCRMMHGRPSQAGPNEVLSSKLHYKYSLLLPDQSMKAHSLCIFNDQASNNSAGLSSTQESTGCTEIQDCSLQHQIVSSFLENERYLPDLHEYQSLSSDWAKERSSVIRFVDDLLSQLEAPLRVFHHSLAMLDTLVLNLTVDKFTSLRNEYLAGVLSLSMKLHWDHHNTSKAISRYFSLRGKTLLEAELTVARALNFRLCVVTADEVVNAIISAESFPFSVGALASVLVGSAVRLCLTQEISACALAAVAVHCAAKTRGYQMADSFKLFSRLPGTMIAEAELVVREASLRRGVFVSE